MGSTGDEADLRAPSAVAPATAVAPLVPGGAGHAVARGDARDPRGGDTEHLDRNPLRPLRRLGAGAALDQGVELLRFRFRRLVGLAACLFLPVQLVDLVLRLTVTASPAEGADLGGAGVFAVGGSDWVAVTVALQAIALSLLGIGVGHLVARLLDGEDTSLRELLGVLARRCWVPLVLVPLALLIRAVLIWIPVVGFVAGDVLVFLASIIVGAERVGPLAALGRNAQLVRSESGAAIAMSLGSLAITMVLRLSLYAGPVTLLASLGPPEGVLIAAEQLGALVQLVIEPLTATIAASAYLLLRCRVDGLDLELRRLERVASRNATAVDATPADAVVPSSAEVLADVAR